MRVITRAITRAKRRQNTLNHEKFCPCDQERVRVASLNVGDIDKQQNTLSEAHHSSAQVMSIRSHGQCINSLPCSHSSAIFVEMNNNRKESFDISIVPNCENRIKDIFKMPRCGECGRNFQGAARVCECWALDTIIPDHENEISIAEPVEILEAQPRRMPETVENNNDGSGMKGVGIGLKLKTTSYNMSRRGWRILKKWRQKFKRKEPPP